MTVANLTCQIAGTPNLESPQSESSVPFETKVCAY